MNEQELFDALDGLMACDQGSTDSGIHDDTLKARVFGYLRSLPEREACIVVARWARTFLTDEALAQGYDIEDVVEIDTWLTEEWQFGA